MKLLIKKIKLIVAYSTENYQILDINSSPFYNLGGLIIELAEFDLEQVKLMMKQFSLELEKEQLEDLKSLLGGHPYFINKALNYLSNNPEITIKKFIQNAPPTMSIYKDDLLDLLNKIRDNEQILFIVKKLIQTEDYLKTDPILMFKLDNLGLIKKSNNEIKIRNQLYRQYLQENL